MKPSRHPGKMHTLHVPMKPRKKLRMKHLKPSTTLLHGYQMCTRLRTTSCPRYFKKCILPHRKRTILAHVRITLALLLCLPPKQTAGEVLLARSNLGAEQHWLRHRGKRGQEGQEIRARSYGILQRWHQAMRGPRSC